MRELQSEIRRGRSYAAGAARGGPRWAGNGPSLSSFYRETKECSLYERVNYPDSIDNSAVLHVFGQQNPAAGLFGAEENQTVPVRSSVQTLKVDGREDIGHLGLNDIESGMKLNLITCDVRIDSELSGCIDKELLKHLEGDHSGSLASMLQD